MRRRGCRSWPVDRERLRVQGKKWPKEGNGQELRRKNQKGRGNQPWLCWLRRKGQERVCSEGESEMGETGGLEPLVFWLMRGESLVLPRGEGKGNRRWRGGGCSKKFGEESQPFFFRVFF